MATISNLTHTRLKDIKQLENYPWTSYPLYIRDNNSDIIDKEIVLSFFPSVDKFISFTNDQVEYQKELNKIKHLVLE